MKAVTAKHYNKSTIISAQTKHGNLRNHAGQNKSQMLFHQPTFGQIDSDIINLPKPEMIPDIPRKFKRSFSKIKEDETVLIKYQDEEANTERRPSLKKKFTRVNW